MSIDSLQRENTRLAQTNNELRRRVAQRSRRALIAEVLFLVGIAAGASGAGLWWKGIADRERLVSTVATLSDNYDRVAVAYESMATSYHEIASTNAVALYGIDYALRSEQAKAGDIMGQLIGNQARLQTCYANNADLREENGRLEERTRRSELSAEQARSDTFTGSIETKRRPSK